MPKPRLRSWSLLALPLLLGFGFSQDKTAPWRRDGAYAGKAACIECHDIEHKAITQGVHARVIEAPLLKACETCHGPGEAHAKHADNDTALITMPKKLAIDAQKQLCGSCHAQQIEQHGGDLVGLLASGRACTACHKVHEKRPAPAHPGVSFASRAQANAGAKGAGSQACAGCHPRRDALLEQSSHHRLAHARHPEGCEKCHGAGELHAATKGIARLITRPDRADDGIATCRQCHENIDEREFHWKDRKKPLLGADLRCTTCHLIHVPKADKAPAAPLAEPRVADTSLTNAICARCHAPAFASAGEAAAGAMRSAAHGGLSGSIHQQIGALDRALDKGCGACHAGAAAHAQGGGKRSLVDSLRASDAKRQWNVCGQCHATERKLVHHSAGAHQRNDVSCTACHQVGARKGTTRQEAQQQCASCHRDVAASFKLPNHHPVPEGRMGCVDCHDPHGARAKVRDLELKQDRCASCHKEYAGPFVFAHQAGRSDGCVACHVPHGASNRRLLQQRDTQQNCLQCHADFPLFHDQTTGVVFTNCLNCHTEVHGSNHSRFLLR